MGRDSKSPKVRPNFVDVAQMFVLGWNWSWGFDAPFFWEALSLHIRYRVSGHECTEYCNWFPVSPLGCQEIYIFLFLWSLHVFVCRCGLGLLSNFKPGARLIISVPFVHFCFNGPHFCLLSEPLENGNDCQNTIWHLSLVISVEQLDRVYSPFHLQVVCPLLNHKIQWHGSVQSAPKDRKFSTPISSVGTVRGLIWYLYKQLFLRL